MKFSIITVTYNSAETLGQTLLSVINQTYQNIEYIVVDGLSTDTTVDIINRYRHGITTVIREKDKGLYDAMNKGIAAATGDVIGFLHSDDFYTDTGVISKYAEVFQKDAADAVYSDLCYVDRENTDKVTRKWISGQYTSGAFLNGWMPPHPTFFARRELFLKFGGFNLALSNSADYELMLRFIQRHEVRVAYLPAMTVKMRMGGQSNASWRNRFNANIEDRKAWKINGLKPRFYTLYLKPFRKIIQFLK